METKNAKVTAVTLKKEGTGQYGKYFVFTVVFDNGDTGDYLAKSNPQTTFKVGEKADYTKETVQNGQYTNVKIKAVTQGNGNGFKPQNQGAANRRTALESAARLINTPDTTEVIRIAEIFLKWLNAGEPVPPKQEQPKTENPPQQDDMPEWLRD